MVHKEISDKNLEEKRSLLYEKFKRNPKISEEITNKNKEIEALKKKLNLLTNKLDDDLFELSVLLEIKDSMKLSLLINESIDSYLKNLREQDLLNNWKLTLSTDSDSSSTKMYSIKNATYTGVIIINHNKKSDYYRVDVGLSLASILLNLVKEHKKKYLQTNNISIIKSGKVVFNEGELNAFVEKTKQDFEKYFLHEKAPLVRKFKDDLNNMHQAEDFLIYDGIIVEGYSIIDEDIKYSEDVPF